MQSTQPIEVICLMDPAIDTGSIPRETLLTFVRTRDNSLLKFHAGKRPTVFVVRHLSRSQRDEIIATCITGEQRAVRAFRYAVIEARNVHGDGAPIASLKPANTNAGWSDDDLDADVFSSAEILDVGSVAWARSFLGRRITPHYQVPPLLQEHWGVLPCLYVAPSDAVTSSAPASKQPASADHAEAPRVEPTESPTDAPAMATTAPAG